MEDVLRNNIFTIIVLGLSGSGKSTLAKGIHTYLSQKEVKSELMDADNYRKILSPDEPFDEKNRNQFRRKLFFIANKLNNHGISVVIPMIASNAKIRQYAKSIINNVYEIYLNTPIETCIQRNPKGLYNKRNNKYYKNIVGLDIPFEKPSNPHITIDTTSIDEQASLDIIIEFLESGLK